MSRDSIDSVPPGPAYVGEDFHPDYLKSVAVVFRMWNARLLRSAAAHYRAAERFRTYETRITFLNITAAILVLFLNGNDEVFQLVPSLLNNSSAVVSMLSFVVVASSACQYFLQFGSKATEHKQAGNEYSNLRRKLERYWSRKNVHPEAVHAINRSYNMITKNPPMVPSDIWRWSARAKIVEAELINKTFFLLEGVELPNDIFSKYDSEKSYGFRAWLRRLLNFRSPP